MKRTDYYLPIEEDSHNFVENNDGLWSWKTYISLSRRKFARCGMKKSRSGSSRLLMYALFLQIKMTMILQEGKFYQQLPMDEKRAYYLDYHREFVFKG